MYDARFMELMEVSNNMFKPGTYKEPAEKILAEVVKIICDEQNRTPGENERFHSHSEAHGFAVMNYLWRSGAIVVVKDEIIGQMSLDVGGK